MRYLNRFKIIVAYLIDIFHSFINSLIYINYGKTILVNAWVEIKYGNIIHRNWGDDINIYLLEKISQKKVIVRNKSLLHKNLKKENFICIGSILGLYENENSIIWGSGFIENNKSLLCKPQKICSVRGKYTRDLLLKAGYNCPSIYGDPALLVSRYYKPLTEKKSIYRIGFILHYVDIPNILINEYLKEHNDCLIISLTDYQKWTDVVDKIYSCEFIISSSLHGLIVSDSYGIPNAWVCLSDKIVGGNFKYLDYFSSVDRMEIRPSTIDSFEDIDRLYDARTFYKKPHIDYECILNSCPFLN